MFGWVEPVYSTNNPIIPGANGFQVPISKPNLNNPRLTNPAPGLGGGKKNTNVSPGSSKPGRAPSGFRTPHKPLTQKPVKQNKFYGGAPGGSGSGSGSGSPTESSNQNTPDSKPSDQCKNLDGFNEGSKKKKKKNSSAIKREKVIEAYNNFLSKMERKGYKLNVSENRFLELSINPQTGDFDQKALFEAEGCLELEAKGIIKNLRRPERTIELDFVAERVASQETIFIDHKGLEDFGSLAAEKKIKVSHFPSHEEAAFNMGKSSIQQKKNVDWQR